MCRHFSLRNLQQIISNLSNGDYHPLNWKRQTERVFSDKFVVTYLAPWDVSNILTPPCGRATSSLFCLVRSFSVDPYYRRIEHDPTYQEIQPQNRPLTSLVENQGFQFYFSRKSTESASLHNIREKRQKRYSCKTISSPSLGLVCIQHTRDYRFNWDAVKIWRLLQKWERPKVTIIS